MQYFFIIRHLAKAQFELRFPDFVGARELFSSIEEAQKEAMSIFLEAVQERFENKSPTAHREAETAKAHRG